MSDADLASNKAVVAALFQAINERRLDELGAYLAVDVVDENKAFLADDTGAELPFDGIPAQLASFDSYLVDVGALVAEGSLVVALVTQHGMHRRPEKIVGRIFENQAAYVFTLSEGKICRVRAISDGSEAGG